MHTKILAAKSVDKTSAGGTQTKMDIKVACNKIMTWSGYTTGPWRDSVEIFFVRDLLPVLNLGEPPTLSTHTPSITLSPCYHTPNFWHPSVACISYLKFSLGRRTNSAPDFTSHYNDDFFRVAHIYGATRWCSGWGTALQTRRSQVPLPMVLLEFFIDINTSGRTMALGSTQPLKVICRLSRNLGATTSWNPWDLSRPVTGIALPFTHLLNEIPITIIIIVPPHWTNLI